jgi:beta-lactamase regulating signal transducer with metallopeptidase domain
MDLLVRSLLTYLLHSTVLLGLAAAGCLALRERRLALQEAILRAALVGGFVTAGLQVGLELKPIGGALTLPAPAAEARGTTVLAPAVRPATVPLVAGPWQTRAVLAPTSVDRVLLAIAGLRFVSWRSALAVAWGALAGLALVRLVVAALRLRRLLRDRQPIRGGRLAPQAATVASALGLRAMVRLSAAPHLGVPLAAGVLWPEVCLPVRVVAELGIDEQVALCAHELAHVARRDPAWILLARLAEVLAPLQPLNAWARRRLQELSECLSDDLAVAASARPVGLARSLVDVASWTHAERPVLPAAAAGAFSARSRLGHRVERLMDPFRSLERPRRALLPLASVVVLATAFLTPVVSGSVSGAVADEPGADAAAQARPVPEATPDPAPRAEAAPRAEPAPETEPAPKARPAPETEAARHDLERQIEALSKHIGERARLHEREMKQLEAQMQALAARFQPNEAELQRLGKGMEAAAQELAAAALENVGEGRGARHGERAAEASRQLAELQHQLRTQNQALGAEQARALSEQARAMSELARPTDAELREMQRLSRELARASVPDLREISRQTHEAMEQARRALLEAMEQARRALQEAAEATRRAAEETRERHE